MKRSSREDFLRTAGVGGFLLSTTGIQVLPRALGMVINHKVVQRVSERGGRREAVRRHATTGKDTLSDSNSTSESV